MNDCGKGKCVFVFVVFIDFFIIVL